VSEDGAFVAAYGLLCSLDTHQVVAHFNGQPLALSRTGRLIVTQITPSPGEFEVQVVDTHTGHVLWSSPTVPDVAPWVNAFDQPGGDGLVVTYTSHPAGGTGTAQGWRFHPDQAPVHLGDNVNQGIE
jgi:hypothetical protein